MANVSDPRMLLELLRQQIEGNLSASTPEASMAKQDMFDLGSFQSVKAFEKEMEDMKLKTAGRKIYHNAAPAKLYEASLRTEKSFITSTGALAVSSGAKTGRCPGDKRIVDEPVGWWAFTNEVWWGKVNIKLSDESFLVNRERAVDYLNTCEELYVVDAFAGWDLNHRIRVRVITCRAYHALFMQNMLVMPTKEELVDFKPDFIIYNAGKFPACRYTKGMTSSASVAMHFRRGEMVILGTEYAGEMKKGILTLMMYAMPKKNQLPLHSSANVGPDGDVTMFFGLSGTGKTTLSADSARKLIGDDEHVWSDDGVFNIEGGCYAKAIDLEHEKEPEIFDAIRFGCVVENVVFNEETRDVDYHDTSITENTRAAYPLHYIPNALIPAKIDTHPSNVILLTCDAFGVLPPVAKLTPAQVQYYFIQGYTAKVAGTEVGVTEPTATFSSCFGAPFLVWHPIIYAEMLAMRLKQHTCDAWLLNTGWTGGAYGKGKRMSIKHTRKLVDAIHSGELSKADYTTIPVFDMQVPTHVEGVPDEILQPSLTWADKAAYDTQLIKLAHLFKNNFYDYADRCPYEVKAAGPFLKVPEIPVSPKDAA
jgi:phosphoenolpyruvate carboxykinase (ATP)